jgi:cytochrome c oxidase subunit I+III
MTEALTKESPERERLELQATWGRKPGVWAWLADTDHKAIGLRFIVTAFVFFVLAGGLAFLMRIQLSRPGNTFLGPDLYNQIFTVHGMTMMFLFAIPVMDGLGLYFVPLMIGTRSLPFPRLNNFSYYLYLFGGIMLWAFFLLNTGPDVGWFSYPPLSGPDYTPGKRADVWAQLITFTEVASLAVAVQLIAVIFKMRAPGMSLNRMPMFVWAQLVMNFMVVFAMPSVMVASSLLILDRLVGTHFYNPAEGGDSLLFQHLFWFFGHPEVYIMFVPALGIVSSIIASSTRRELIGYPALVLSLIATGFIGFGVWVHHMFATGLPQMSISFFTVASLLIVVPTGVQMFCWISTIWSGRPRLSVPFLYVLGFVVIFVLGGLTGVILAAVPIDWQVHDTFFVVAHFHYVIIGGVVFPLLGGIHHWFPKFTGRMYNERLGRISFALNFIGFNVTFFPMHQLGLEGMPRRIYTYDAALGWGGLNLLASVGAGILLLGGLVFLYNMMRSYLAGAPAPADPWDADSLEWSTTSPPPAFNFLRLPVVQGRYARWQRRKPELTVTGLSATTREVLVTDVMDAEPDHIEKVPKATIWTFWTAIAVTALFIGTMFAGRTLFYLAVPLAFTGTMWFRAGLPSRKDYPPDAKRLAEAEAEP